MSEFDDVAVHTMSLLCGAKDKTAIALVTLLKVLVVRWAQETARSQYLGL